MTQSSRHTTVRVFSARACAAPMEKAARLFEQQANITVEIDVCFRHCATANAEEALGGSGGDDFLVEIADAAVHDLAIGGAPVLPAMRLGSTRNRLGRAGRAHLRFGAVIA